jgi:hypothetical protein
MKPKTPEEMFFEITGVDYIPTKTVTSKPETPDTVARKIERKSERSAVSKLKHQDQDA